MIYDTLARAALYLGLSPNLDRALDCLAKTDFDALAPGRYEVDGERVYFMIQEPALRPRAETAWEAHRRYIDIQMGLADGEVIGYLPIEQIDDWDAYDEDKDAAKSASDRVGIVMPLHRQMFGIFFPEDAHRPCERLGDAEGSRKLVIKVLVEG